MTADIELIPLPEPRVKTGNHLQLIYFTGAQMEAYARANVAHATAAKDAEIEALRVDLETSKRHSDRMFEAYQQTQAQGSGGEVAEVKEVDVYEQHGRGWHKDARILPSGHMPDVGTKLHTAPPSAPVGVPVDVVREYLDARACYEAATRTPNSHARAPVLKHDDPDARRLREARVALDNAIAIAQQPPAEAQTQGGGEDREPDDGKVICPSCCHQFRAIPVQVQRDMIVAGFEPPFTAPPSAPPPKFNPAIKMGNKTAQEAFEAWGGDSHQWEAFSAGFETHRQSEDIASPAQQPAAVDETAELVGLLDEVRSHFTRDDDLPDDLLPRIDAALRWVAGGES